MSDPADDGAAAAWAAALARLVERFLAAGGSADDRATDAVNVLAPLAPLGRLSLLIVDPDGALVARLAVRPWIAPGTAVAGPATAARAALDAGLPAHLHLGDAGGDAAIAALQRAHGFATVMVPLRARGVTHAALACAEPPGARVAATMAGLTAAADILAALTVAGPAGTRDATLEMLGMLTAGVVHELGSPLQAIIGLAGVLTRNPEGADRLDAANRILRAARRCQGIAQDILALARTPGPPPGACDPRAAVLDALDLDRFSDAGEVDVHLPDGPPPPPVLIESRRLVQVIVNLLTNARHAVGQTPDARVAVALQVVPPEPGRAAVVRIIVDDNGPGIPAGLGERVFAPFFTTKPAGQGTGLGLHLSRTIIEQAGGTLTFEGLRPHGTRFVVELPAAATADAAPAPPAAPPSHRSILVIDDDREVLETYELVLALDQHRVVTCTRGTEGLAACAHASFDAIICDMRLPDMTGATFLTRLAEQAPDLVPRVILATGDVTSPDTRAFVDRLSNPVLQKPFEIAELEAALARVIQHPG